MKCYIKVENGQAIGHPVLEENLLDIHQQIPHGWEPLALTEIDVENPNFFKKLAEHPTYQQVDGVWTQVWVYVDKTPEEKAAVVKAAWEILVLVRKQYADNFSSWVYDPTKNGFFAPVPKPTDGNYRWHGASNSWKEAPLKPTDGKKYEFNFYTWAWDEVVE